MRGILFDVNIQGHSTYVVHILKKLDIHSVFEELTIRILTFRDVGLHPKTNDRDIWIYCQANGLVLITENRNDDGPDSLESTIREMNVEDSDPVITIGDKGKFENNQTYALLVVNQLADILFDMHKTKKHRGRGRIYLPS